jgi:acyl-CoA reductase-like NAD-dependent aldehyde dehydrogenase
VDRIEPFWVAGRRVDDAGPDGRLADVRSPYDSRLVGRVALPSAADVDEAMDAADAVRAEAAALPAHMRADALAHVSRRLAARAEPLAKLITAESGKPVKWADVEVSRAVGTFRAAAEEARRFDGEWQRLDTDPTGTGRLALLRRFPRGPVLAITPFNFPLNLVAHKVAPALAVGAPVVVKPAPATPLSALALAEILAETDLPAGMWSVLPVPNDEAGTLVADPRLPVVSFTGSAPVGASIRRTVPDKHVILELGGNAAVVVCADYTDEADLGHAAERIATFAHYQAGQSCISVQRLYADRGVYDRLLEKVLGAVGRLRTGDPADPGTDVGPLINQAALERTETWIAEALDQGAKVLTGGTRRDGGYAPTVLTDVPAQARVAAEEVFAPVLVAEPVDSVEEAFARVNHSRYGLQAGVFTRDLRTAFRAHRDLEVGGVIIGDVPSYRADAMPYGGVKDSGEGREGPRWAMHDLTSPRVLVLSGLDL